MAPTYWLDLFTYETWTEFLKAGASVTGFRENRWRTVRNITPGDIFLCYLTGVSRWIGILEVTGPAFKDTRKIWTRADFPVRIHVKLLAKLDPLTAVPVVEMKKQLSIFQNLKSPHAWTAHFRLSPAKLSSTDGSVYDVVWCRWPRREDRLGPGPWVRPALVLDVRIMLDERNQTTWAAVTAAYGTALEHLQPSDILGSLLITTVECADLGLVTTANQIRTY